MNDERSYQIRIQGHAGQDELNALSPIRLKLVRVEAESTCLAAETDQSGLIGLLRHLHARGYTLLSIRSGPQTNSEEE